MLTFIPRFCRMTLKLEVIFSFYILILGPSPGHIKVIKSAIFHSKIHFLLLYMRDQCLHLHYVGLLNVIG